MHIAVTATGVAQRDSIAPSQRSATAADVTCASARTWRRRRRSRRSSPARKGRSGGEAESRAQAARASATRAGPPRRTCRRTPARQGSSTKGSSTPSRRARRSHRGGCRTPRRRRSRRRPPRARARPTARAAPPRTRSPGRDSRRRSGSPTRARAARSVAARAAPRARARLRRRDTAADRTRRRGPRRQTQRSQRARTRRARVPRRPCRALRGVGRPAASRASGRRHAPAACCSPCSRRRSGRSSGRGRGRARRDGGCGASAPRAGPSRPRRARARRRAARARARPTAPAVPAGAPPTRRCRPVREVRRHPAADRAGACVLSQRSPKPDDRTSDTRLDGRETGTRGLGGLLAERLEERVAGLLSKDEAVWMPSGTMAQQIALRVHARRSGRELVAFHPLCHLDVHEERGYEWLHGLRAATLGHRDRLVTTADVEGLAEPVAAVLLELPQRDLGGRLPAWDDLFATVDAARAGGAAVHLYGARLWQCGPFYERALDEIAGLFDTVYVSFYKDLRAPAGCALAGPADFVAEARVWQVR